MPFFLMIVLTGTITVFFTSVCLYSKSTSTAKKIWIFAAVLFAWFAPFFLRKLEQCGWLGSSADGWLHNIGYYLFGTAFFLFSVLLLRNIVWYGTYGIARLLKKPFARRIDPDRPDLRGTVNRVTLCAAFLISFYAVYEGVKAADVKEIVLKTDKVNQPFTFVQLSDIHIHRGVSIKKIERLVERVNGLKADAVLLTGDIGDDKSPEAGLIARKLEKLSSRFGSFVVMGNHELYNKHQVWEQVFKVSGIRVLYNEGTALGRPDIFIGGVTDASFRRFKNLKPDIGKAMFRAEPGQYRILMSHSPLPNGKEAPDQSELFDLQISGHTHGGQIFPFHFLVKPVNKYLAGLYAAENSDSKIYVSRGTGYWGPPMRLFAPSEITVFKILPLQAQTSADDQGNG
ncbi:MAG: metallophosphoesterase [Alphaproteobacteria bacterium]